MNMPCDKAIICECSDNPITNYSEESPDAIVCHYRAVNWQPALLGQTSDTLTVGDAELVNGIVVTP